jgi:hypothetical protein
VNKSLKLSGQIFASVLVLTVFGCGSDSAKQTDPANTSEQVTLTTQATQSSSPAIFTATLLSGATFDSAKVLESQPLALWFWAPG